MLFSFYITGCRFKERKMECEMIIIVYRRGRWLMDIAAAVWKSGRDRVFVFSFENDLRQRPKSHVGPKLNARHLKMCRKLYIYFTVYTYIYYLYIPIYMSNRYAIFFHHPGDKQWTVRNTNIIPQLMQCIMCMCRYI